MPLQASDINLPIVAHMVGTHYLNPDFGFVFNYTATLKETLGRRDLFCWSSSRSYFNVIFLLQEDGFKSLKLFEGSH